MPSDDCWPTSSDWSSLNATIDGHLIRAAPPAAPCYQGHANYDAVKCSDIIGNWASSAWRAANPVSVDASYNANNTCDPIYPNGTSITGDPHAGSRGCDHGWYPVYVVNATHAAGVKAGVKFARQHNLRLNVENTGHGRSATPGSLSIWTHYLKDFSFQVSFRAQGCNLTRSSHTGQMAMTVGAGAQDRELFELAASHDAVVVGGTDSTVGLIGWATGGGHEYLTSSYGMGADNIIEATVVTAAGNIVTANECQNSDLFWAIRGGGGGTFGVITQVTVKAFPMPSVTFWNLAVSQKNGSDISRWWDAIAHVFSEFPQLKKAGLQGYTTVSGAPMSFTNAMFMYNVSKTTVQNLIDPALNQLERFNDTAVVTSQLVTLPRWIDFYHMFNLTEAAGNLTEAAGNSGGVTASRLLPTRASTDDVDHLARVLEKVGPKPKNPSVSVGVPKVDVEKLIKYQGGVSNPSLAGSVVGHSRHVDNSLNPAWRDAVIHLIIKEGWSDGLSPDKVKAVNLDMVYNKGYALRQLAPDSGAYFNEANYHEPNWQWQLFGKNYPRLRSIKQKYDPSGLQWCNRCVGSED